MELHVPSILTFAVVSPTMRTLSDCMNDCNECLYRLESARSQLNEPSATPMNDLEKHCHPDDDDDVVTETAVVEHDQYIYVDFSAFRHFGDVKLLQTTSHGEQIPVVFTDGLTPLEKSGAAPRLTIVKGSLETDRPLMQFGSSTFQGTWNSDHVCESSMTRRTNFVVAELVRRSPKAAASKEAQKKSKRPRPDELGGSETHVPSLLSHLPHGTDSDTAAKLVKMQRAENESEWSVGSVVAPSAVITMERLI